MGAEVAGSVRPVVGVSGIVGIVSGVVVGSGKDTAAGVGAGVSGGVCTTGVGFGVEDGGCGGCVAGAVVAAVPPAFTCIPVPVGPTSKEERSFPRSSKKLLKAAEIEYWKAEVI